jgi:hypothetical protein
MCRREGDKGQTTGGVVNREKIQYKIVGGIKMNFEKRFCFDWVEKCAQKCALYHGGQIKIIKRCKASLKKIILLKIN